MNTNRPTYTGKDAISRLAQYCADNQLSRFLLVADQNTYPVLGQAVEDRLKSQGADVKTVILTGEEVMPDEHYLVQVLVHADTKDRTYLAVGSGTITDITRFVSHRTKSPFISVPTAPSVDGFTSIGAPLVVGGLKQTVIAQPPVAVFADLATLRTAPRPMIASGFGDMLGKFTSLADWRLGHLLWDEPYDERIAQRAQTAVRNCAGQAEAIGRASDEGVRALMEGLIESGLCMLEAGSSRPASGMEHHLSHYWEMKLLWEGRPAILHGAKVGVATMMAAGYYRKIRQMTRQQAIELLNTSTLPNREEDIRRIRSVHGPIADRVIAAQAPFLDMSEQAYEQLKQKIIDGWPDIQQIAATVPAPQELAGWLRTAGGPTDAKTLGLNDQEVANAVAHSHFLRNRFTVAKLSRILGIL